VLGAPPAEGPLYANFEITPVTGKQPVNATMSAEATLGCNTITSYAWDFGNGGFSSLANPGVTFNQQGVFPVSLMVTDNLGNSHQLTKKIVVGPSEGNVKLHFRRPAGWSNIPNAYFWNPEPVASTPGWPGTPMTDEGFGWYGITLSGAKCANVIFNNNSNPQTADLVNICGEQWFDNGWLSQILPDANLPVRLLSFDAVAAPARVELSWKVTAENDVAGYTLERSINGANFVPVHSQAARNQPGAQVYRFTDSKLPSAPTVYYRLQLNDKDGQVRHSPVKKVNLLETGAVEWTASPNPVKQQFFITASQHAPDIKSSRLVNSNGQIIYIQQIAPGQRQIQLDRKSGWQPGLYWVELINESGVAIQRIKIMME
jgi:PKD repeat protein